MSQTTLYGYLWTQIVYFALRSRPEGTVFPPEPSLQQISTKIIKRGVLYLRSSQNNTLDSFLYYSLNFSTVSYFLLLSILFYFSKNQRSCIEIFLLHITLWDQSMVAHLLNIIWPQRNSMWNFWAYHRVRRMILEKKIMFLNLISSLITFRRKSS